MGGLKKQLPMTFPTFLVGALAISGIPLLVGLLLQGRDPRRARSPAGTARSSSALGLARRRPDGVLHVPARLPDLLRRGPGEPRGRAPRPRVAAVDDRPARRPGRASRSLAGFVGLPAALRRLEPTSSAGFLRGHRSRRQPSPGRRRPSGVLDRSRRRPSVAARHRSGLSASTARTPPRRRPPRSALARHLPAPRRNKYYVDEVYDAVVVRPLVRGSDWLYGRFRPQGHRRRRQRRRPPPRSAGRAA
ncbi:MAG: hypothetical protein MZV64_64220 [Ignavibacteriales bacterium]|nr:hypothetical protein [Ignavibacteriales bacterium]